MQLYNIKNNILANNLTTLLLKHNLSINKFATLLNLPMMTIRRLLSGETTDPRISTLKIIAEYFKIPVDTLINAHDTQDIIVNIQQHTYSLPILTWEQLSHWHEDQINFKQQHTTKYCTVHYPTALNQHAFAIESQPSMYIKYPKGTLLILDQTTTPADGDLVLIKLRDQNAFTLRELSIDPPNWHCLPITPHASCFNFSTEQHQIIAVNLLTMLYNHRS